MNKNNSKKNYYEVLGISKNAQLDQIKQSYKKLALKYHPDKNQDKQKAKKMFTQISQAYGVLIDPKKRQMYDKYGTVDQQEINLDFQQFFTHNFGEFQEFLEQMMGFHQMNQMQKMFKNLFKGGPRKSKRAGRGGGSMNKKLFEMFDFADLTSHMPKQKPKQKKSKQEQQWQTESEGEEWVDEDDEEQKIETNDRGKDLFNFLNQQEQIMMFPVFIEENTHQKKRNKKVTYKCKLDQKQLTEDELMDHFYDNHLKQFKKWYQDNDF